MLKKERKCRRYQFYNKRIKGYIKSLIRNVLEEKFLI